MKDSSLYRSILSRVRTDVGKTYHDINNPLAIISGNVQLLEQLLVMQDTDPTIMEVVDDIRVACDKMTEASRELDTLRMEIASILDDAPDEEA